jgi:hypothetical protein
MKNTRNNVPIWTKNLTNFFSEARHHRADQNSKIMAIEPMNRKEPSISRDKSAAKSAERNN